MKIAITSMFRDSSEEYIAEYLDRAKSISGLDLHWFLVEGDSRDDTLGILEKLTRNDDRFTVLTVKTGIPHFGSVIHSARFKCLCRTTNVGIEAAEKSGIPFDYYWYLDSDLIYHPDLPCQLISASKDIISPMIMARGMFYDTWGVRGMDGDSVGPGTRWIKSDDLVQITSTGACVLSRYEFVQRGARMTEGDHIVGFCHEAARRGARVWLDPTSVIWHPVHGMGNTYSEHINEWGEQVPYLDRQTNGP